MIETVYKILTNAEWADFQSAGSFEGSPVDLEDGYLHFSAADQVAETAEKHFSGQQGLWLVAVQADPKNPHWKWEKSRNGALFPHLYESLAIHNVVSATPIATGADGRFKLESL
ncbi:MAG: DUF952 domain-containing protein [Planctomycetota bacterium]|jgi:uncharacterized protein (DUF952 family)|nr:DUF952 domain-containing protein [Planctomycetota bacterium]